MPPIDAVLAARYVEGLESKAVWEMDPLELTRTVAKHLGWREGARGWIEKANGFPMVHGWDRLSDELLRLQVIVPTRGIDWRKAAGYDRCPPRLISLRIRASRARRAR